MRQIQVEDGLRLRFPGRGDEFDDGVEIGLLIVSLASGEARFQRIVSAGNVDQARHVAEGLGYRVQILTERDDRAELFFFIPGRRPVLTLVQTDVRFA